MNKLYKTKDDYLNLNGMRGGSNKEIYFLRHGETEWNRLGLGQGANNDIPINDTGIEQAKITGRYLNEFRQLDKKFDLMVSSPMRRTKETAKIVANIIGYDPQKIIYMDELKEIDSGLLNVGKTDDEMRKDPLYNKYFELYDRGMGIKDPIQGTIEYINDSEELSQLYGVETFEHLNHRIRKVFDFITKSNKSKILVVTHNGVITNGVGSFFNIQNLRGDYKYGTNCHITYIINQGTNYKLLYGPSTAHFKIYGKDYSKTKMIKSSN